MTCIKCGLNEAVTTAGLCRQCQIYAQPLVHLDLAQEALATCNVCGMYYYPSKGACLHQESKFLDKETLERFKNGTPPASDPVNVRKCICGSTDVEVHRDGQSWECRVCRQMTFRVEPSASTVLRMPWDVYFLAICDAVKLRSIDKETQNGSVIVNAKRQIVRTGYNAFPAGVDDSFWPRDRETQVRVPYAGFSRAASETHAGVRWASELALGKSNSYEVDKYMAMTHAEMNAVVSAGQDLHGCCIYTLLFPCHECAKAIITSGIKRVVFVTTREDPSWAVAKELFIQAGVELVGPEKP